MTVSSRNETILKLTAELQTVAEIALFLEIPTYIVRNVYARSRVRRYVLGTLRWGDALKYRTNDVLARDAYLDARAHLPLSKRVGSDEDAVAHCQKTWPLVMTGDRTFSQVFHLPTWFLQMKPQPGQPAPSDPLPCPADTAAAAVLAADVAKLISQADQEDGKSPVPSTPGTTSITFHTKACDFFAAAQALAPNCKSFQITQDSLGAVHVEAEITEHKHLS